jgi:catechol 2,3-dioxygenase-like lactoylglutathione lyase family enzyme
MLLGKFLEVSVHAPDVAESLAFYESLGFVQAETGEAWPHPYAVVTDGRLFIGLHQHPIASPALTWVLPDLAQHVAALQALGIEFEFARLGEAAMHQIGFRDTSGQMITVIEARTFSPPALAPSFETQLGYFEEFVIPTRELERGSGFWDRLGLIAFDPEYEPLRRVAVASRDLNLGLYDAGLPSAMLAFSDSAMAQRIVTLRDRGLRFAAHVPDRLDPVENAVLQTPEGTLLLLTTTRS